MHLLCDREQWPLFSTYCVTQSSNFCYAFIVCDRAETFIKHLLCDTEQQLLLSTYCVTDSSDFCQAFTAWHRAVTSIKHLLCDTEQQILLSTYCVTQSNNFCYALTVWQRAVTSVKHLQIFTNIPHKLAGMWSWDWNILKKPYDLNSLCSYKYIQWKTSSKNC